MVGMKRTDIFVKMRLFVNYYAYHLESGLSDNFEKSAVEAHADFSIAQYAKRTFAVYDIGTMQNNGLVRSRAKDSSFETFKIICKCDVVIRLLKPHTQKCKVSVRNFLKKVIRMIA